MLVAMQHVFRQSGQALIHPYQFPVALSADGNLLLVKEKTSDSFAFRAYWNDTEVAKLSFDSPQWEISWNPSGTAVSFLAEVSATSGTYAPYVWWISQDHATVLDGPTTRRAAYAFRWSPDGAYVSYISASREDSKLIILAIQKGASWTKAVIDDVYPDAGMAWSSDGREVLYAQLDQNGFVIHRFSISDATTTDLGHLPHGDLRDLSWSPSVDTVATSFRGESDNYFRLALLSRDGKLHICSPEDGDVLSPIGVQVDNMLEMVVEKDSDQSVHLSRGCSRSIEIYRPPSGAGRLQNDGYLHNPSPFIESRPDAAPQLILLNRASQPSTQLEQSSAPSAFTARKIQIFRSTHAVHAWIWEPNFDNQPDRAIVMVHGGPRLHETNEWEPLRSALRQHGYLIIGLNYGGSTGYGKRYEDIQGLDAQADDIVTTIQYLMDVRRIRRDHIAIFVSSYGTRVLLRALRDNANLAPVVIFAPFLAPQFEAKEPIPFHGKIVAFHGSKDPISPPNIAFSEIRKVFPDASSKHELYWRLFGNEPHGSNRVATLQEEYGTIVCVLEPAVCKANARPVN